MSTYKNTCESCDDTYETECWEPSQCPFCEVEFLKSRINELETVLKEIKLWYPVGSQLIFGHLIADKVAKVLDNSQK